VAIVAALIDGAKAEDRPEYVHFAEKLVCACAHGGKGVLSDSAAPRYLKASLHDSKVQAT
jgi:hypothetical protein